jgi:glycosyltransferase involved in cell wall biosynthesis
LSAPVRVLHLVPRFIRGGVARVIDDLRSGADASRYETFLACGVDDYPERAGVYSGLPLFPTTPANAVRGFFAVRRLVQELGIDVLHSHHRFTSVVARLVSMTTGCRFTSTVHDLAAGSTRMTRFGVAPVVTVFSEAVERHLIESFGVSADKIQRIPMGIAPMARLGSACGSAPMVVFAGRLDWEKGADIFVAAIPEILRCVPEAIFSIAGTGELEGELRGRAAAFADRVQFLGWREDIAALIGSAGVAVVPSRREGFGRSVVEAMSLGVPVVASATGEIVNLIDDGVNGLLVPPGDSAALAGAVVRLLLDRPLAERIAAAGEASTAGRYSIEAMCRATEKVYERLLAS